MKEGLLPIFFTVNSDTSVKYERGNDSEVIEGKNLEDLFEPPIRVVLPENKEEKIYVEDSPAKANVLLFNITADTRRGEQNLACYYRLNK